MSSGKPLVVFLRAVNVGGRTVRTAELAGKLGAHNVGAAGTFVLPGGAESAVRKAIRKALEFDCEVMICSGGDLAALADSASAASARYERDYRTFVTVLSGGPRSAAKLPVSVPDGKDWQVRVVAVEGPFVISDWRRRPGRLIYPNEVVEKVFGVPGTTRGWSTIGSIRKIVEKGAEKEKKRQPR
jgi:uncharacterized protein (DUF1697 family)